MFETNASTRNKERRCVRVFISMCIYVCVRLRASVYVCVRVEDDGGEKYNYNEAQCTL